MKLRNWIIILTLVFISCSTGPQVQWEPFTDQAFKEAADAGQPTIVYFYAAWCHPCQMLKQNVFSNEDVIRELEGFKRLKADVSFREKAENVELQRRFGVMGLPTIIFFNTRAPGAEVARFSGLATAEQFLNYLQRIQERPY